MKHKAIWILVILILVGISIFSILVYERVNEPEQYQSGEPKTIIQYGEATENWGYNFFDNKSEFENHHRIYSRASYEVPKDRKGRRKIELATEFMISEMGYKDINKNNQIYYGGLHIISPKDPYYNGDNCLDALKTESLASNVDLNRKLLIKGTTVYEKTNDGGDFVNGYVWCNEENQFVIIARGYDNRPQYRENRFYITEKIRDMYFEKFK